MSMSMSPVARRAAAASGLTALLIGLTAGAAARREAVAATATPVVALPGYQVSTFAAGTAAYSNPDSIVSAGGRVYVGYQNITAKDGADHKTSTIVEYTARGSVVRTFDVLGHCDGLRYNPMTRQLWALTNEDGNPHLTTIDPTSGATTLYRSIATPHGGGYDDMAFTNGMALMDASNPSVNGVGANTHPALDKVTLSHGKVSLTPLLMGNGTALDTTTNKKVTLNEVDPDSMTIDPRGNLVMDNQAGSELVFISGVGTAHPYVTRVPLGTQVDDTIWPSASQGRILVTDTKANAIYALRTTFVPGTAYAAAPNDSGVAGMVGTIDLSTGIITPVAIGLLSPHGEAFLPDAAH